MRSTAFRGISLEVRWQGLLTPMTCQVRDMTTGTMIGISLTSAIMLTKTIMTMKTKTMTMRKKKRMNQTKIAQVVKDVLVARTA